MMIKRLFSIVLIAFFSSLQGQKLIVSEQFNTKDYPVGFDFLPNKNRVVIQKGPILHTATNNLLGFIYSYDHEGFREVLSDKGGLMNCVFSPTENSFSVSRFSLSDPSGDQYKIVSDGESSPFYNMKDAFQYFNDEYAFSIVNGKQNVSFDFLKDDIYLTKINFKTNINSKIKLKKPDLTRITGDAFAKNANNVTYSIRTNEANFGMVTKSIDKQYQSSVLYRSIYSLEGELLEDLKYEIKIPNQFLIYCNNGGGFINTNAENGNVYISDLTINNFVVDKKTGDVFVYGLFGEQAKSSSSITNKPTGFYVFKFDKSGNKIWESLQKIDDKIHFNANQVISNIKCNLMLTNGTALVSISSSLKNDGYIHYAVLNNETGSLVKKNKMNFERTENENENKNFIPFMPYNVKGFENKSIDIEGIIANDIFPNYSKYLASNQSKVKLHFKTFIGKEGIWLLESDNTSYYKLLFFKV
jgi:hypothetical protein